MGPLKVLLSVNIAMEKHPIQGGGGLEILALFQLACTLYTDYLDIVLISRQSDVMVNVQFSGSSGADSRPSEVLCKTLHSQCLSPPRCINGFWQI